MVKSKQYPYSTHEPLQTSARSQYSRVKSMLPTGIPRYVRVYDWGSHILEDRYDWGSHIFEDRYTVVFTGVKGGTYLAMSENPYDPQGFCQHGEGLIDRYDDSKLQRRILRPPMLGRENHLGLRIRFLDLPFDCRNVIVNDYISDWGLTPSLTFQWANSHVEDKGDSYYATT